MATVWQISQMERTIADGGVVVCHWRATATDGDFSATNYGTCGFTPDPSSSDWVAYDSISEELALSWCFGQVLTRTLLKRHWRLTLKHRRTQRKHQEYRGKLKKGEIQWLRKKQRQFQ